MAELDEPGMGEGIRARATMINDLYWYTIL